MKILIGTLSFAVFLGWVPLNSWAQVQTSLVTGAKLDEWLCGQKVHVAELNMETACGTAGFKKCVRCGTLVVTNGSNAQISARVEVNGLGFSTASAGPMVFGLVCKTGSRRWDGDGQYGCSELAPGGRCFEDVEFCPEQSGKSRGRITVVTDRHKMIFNLVGKAVYSPELTAADEARQHYLGKLAKIPKVAKVVLDKTGGKILIDVEVEQGVDSVETSNNLAMVRRAVPAEVGGYNVEVTQYLPTESSL